MAPLKAGDKFPEGVKFDWAPITDESPTSCGMPQEYDASKEFQGKKVVLVSVPGAFTPSCQAMHVPPYLKNIDKLLQKGIDQVVIIGFNDAFVMAGWAKVNGVKPNSKIYFMGDTKTKFSEQHAWMAGMGERNGRWAMVIEKDGTISYSETEKDPREVTVSGADAILARL